MINIVYVEYDFFFDEKGNKNLYVESVITEKRFKEDIEKDLINQGVSYKVLNYDEFYNVQETVFSKKYGCVFSKEEILQ